MYIVLIEDYPARSNNQLQIEYFKTAEDAGNFVNELMNVKPSQYSRSTRIKICQKLSEISVNTDRFNYT